VIVLDVRAAARYVDTPAALVRRDTTAVLEPLQSCALRGKQEHENQYSPKDHKRIDVQLDHHQSKQPNEPDRPRDSFAGASVEGV
jgi:hypothetical protein